MAWFDRNPNEKKEPENQRPMGSEPRSVTVPKAPEPAPVKEPPRPAEEAVVASLLKGSRVTGQLNFQGAAKIDGIVDGEIQCQGRLVIGEGAEVRAKITGQTVVVHGRVEGNVVAKERLELVSPAKLYGNIVTPRLTVGEGVVFDGECSMGTTKHKARVGSIQSVNAEVAAAVQAPKLQADSEK